MRATRQVVVAVVTGCGGAGALRASPALPLQYVTLSARRQKALEEGDGASSAVGGRWVSPSACMGDAAKSGRGAQDARFALTLPPLPPMPSHVERGWPPQSSAALLVRLSRRGWACITAWWREGCARHWPTTARRRRFVPWRLRRREWRCFRGGRNRYWTSHGVSIGGRFSVSGYVRCLTLAEVGAMARCRSRQIGRRRCVLVARRPRGRGWRAPWMRVIATGPT